MPVQSRLVHAQSQWTNLRFAPSSIIHPSSPIPESPSGGLALFLNSRFPSFAVSSEGAKGEAPNMFYPQPPSVISNLNSLLLFTSTLRATTSSPFTSKGKR
ncbi:hypothetical protein NMG60_11005538 [Bertholletia excelsa]